MGKVLIGNIKGEPGLPGIKGDKGCQWCGKYVEGVSYKVDDVVEYNGSTYICIQDKDNDQAPTTHPDYWQLFVAKGEDGRSFTWRGEWASSEEYKVDDVVKYNGSSYICILDAKNEREPIENINFWELFVAKGADGKDGVDGKDGSSADFSNLTEIEVAADQVEIDDDGFTIEGDTIFKDDSSSYSIHSYTRIPLVSGEGVSIDKTKTDKVVIALDSEMILQVLSNYYTKKEVEEYIDNYINSALGGDY